VVAVNACWVRPLSRPEASLCAAIAQLLMKPLDDLEVQVGGVEGFLQGGGAVGERPEGSGLCVHLFGGMSGRDVGFYAFCCAGEVAWQP